MLKVLEIFLGAGIFLSVGCQTSPHARDEPTADPGGIRETVREHMKELRACYYQILETHPAAEGKLTMIWEVNAEGRATGTSLKSAEGKRGIEAVAPCLKERIEAWQFLKSSPDDSTVVTYPFYFSENGKAKFE